MGNLQRFFEIIKYLFEIIFQQNNKLLKKLSYSKIKVSCSSKTATFKVKNKNLWHNSWLIDKTIDKYTVWKTRKDPCICRV